MQLYALFRLGFPSAPRLLSLNLAAYHNSQAHSTKGTPSPFRASTACGSMVSGSLSLPSRGSFHLSLTVLCAIGSCRVFSLGGWSPRLQAGFHVPRPTQDAAKRGRRSLQACHLLRGGFPSRFGLLFRVTRQSYNPGIAPGLGFSPFARRYLGNLG